MIVDGIFFVLAVCRTSCAIPMALCTCLPFRKANCSCEIELDKIFFNLLAMNLAIIFLVQLQMDMGL